MAHSHDRTLLASLGFSDPDKREPLHDLACEYLAEPIQAQRLVRLACSVQEDALIHTNSRLEVAISKGEGQYRTTIGFMDLCIEWKTNNRKGKVIVETKIHPIAVGDILRQINLYRGYVWSPTPVDAENFRDRLRKIQLSGGLPEGMDEGASWVLASAFNLDAGQTDLLNREGVRSIHLGDGFTKWFERRQQRPAPKSEEF